MGDGVDDFSSQTGTVAWRVLSPAHYLDAATTQSGMFIVALEAVADADRPAFRAAMIDAIEPYFDDGRNAVRMEYRLTTATVD